MNKVIQAAYLSDFDVHLYCTGKHFNAYEKMGVHSGTLKKQKGFYFTVWAPNAKLVNVMGDFNQWNKSSHALFPRKDGSGFWEGFIPDLKVGFSFKYYIVSKFENRILEKGDPYANYWEVPPLTASKIYESNYKWNDEKWLKEREKNNSLNSPWSVYELHLGSWKRKKIKPGAEEAETLTYRELAKELIPYVKDLGFTHVEFMPVMEHPYDGSWGYQICGFYAPTSRFGSPDDFKFLIDALHQAEIGVILDWVPSHFPYDIHGLFKFDGTSLYEHEDPRKGYHPDWNSYIFNYGRGEVKSFLISNALFWFDKFHIDGIRVDAVASMLHLNFSRKDGEWIPNKFGGVENLEAVEFLKELNIQIYGRFKGVQTIAEESSTWPKVSRPVHEGGLGFGMKWMMGWMNDTLEYFKMDPLFRKFHHGKINFSIHYAYTENFMLPLSHDEVVHMKSPLIGKMPGNESSRFAHLRLLFAYMFTHPGAKLLFMGGEFGQTNEWNYKSQIQWELLHFKVHKGIQNLIRDLNHLYRTEKALYELQFDYKGFEWINADDAQNSVLVYLRKGKLKSNRLLIICNFTPVERNDYPMVINEGKNWVEVFNSNNELYGGTEKWKSKKYKTQTVEITKGKKLNVLKVNLPELGVLILKSTR